jgi:hypothetical protein
MLPDACRLIQMVNGRKPYVSSIRPNHAHVKTIFFPLEECVRESGGKIQRRLPFALSLNYLDLFADNNLRVFLI